jgi:hypothetical protein
MVYVEFNASIPKFINVIVQLIFMNLIQNNFPTLFTAAWVQDNSRATLNLILKTVSQELDDLEKNSLIVNIIHYRMLAKEALEYLVNAYVEQFILAVRVIYNLRSTDPLKYCSEACTSKKLKEGKEDPKTVFTSLKNQLIDSIKKDKQVYLRFS